MPGGRRQDPVDPAGGPATQFALQLRELQSEAGLTVTQLAAATHYDVSTVSKALNGRKLPSWALTSAVVKACGADPAAWKNRWMTARALSKAAPSGEVRVLVSPEAAADENLKPVLTPDVDGSMGGDPARLPSPSPLRPAGAKPPGDVDESIVSDPSPQILSPPSSRSGARRRGVAAVTTPSEVDDVRQAQRGAIFIGALLVAVVALTLSLSSSVNSTPGTPTSRSIAVTPSSTRVVTSVPEPTPTVGAAPVLAVATAELGGRPVVISSNGDTTARVRDLATKQPLVSFRFSGRTGPLYAMATAQLEGRPVVISGGSNEMVLVSDLATGQQLGSPFIGHTDQVNGLATAELGVRPVVISGSRDGTVRVWDLESGEPVGSPITDHIGPVWAVATAQLDGRSVVVSGGDDGTVRVWDLATGEPVASPFTGRGAAVWAVATAQLDGRPVVVSGGDDGTVRVSDLATGQQLGRPFTGHTGPVHAVATAELGGRSVVISGSRDATVRVWDLATGEPVGSPVTGHTPRGSGRGPPHHGGRDGVCYGSGATRSWCRGWRPLSWVSVRW